MLDKLSSTSEELFRDLLDGEILIDKGCPPVRHTVEGEAHRTYLLSSVPDDTEGPCVTLYLPTATLCADSAQCSSELCVARDDSKTEGTIIAPEPLAYITWSKSEERDNVSVPAR